MSADLLARLIEAGTPAALVGEVAMALARAETAASAEREPTAGALRTRRWRERHGTSPNVTCDAGDAPVTENVTTTPSPSPSFPSNSQTNPTHTPAEQTRARKGTRLPVDFTLPDDWLEWAIAERGWSRVDAENEGDSFCDHWRAKPGAGATKLDWQATWRNWVRNSRRVGRNGTRSTQPSGIGRTGEAGIDVFGHPGGGPH